MPYIAHFHHFSICNQNQSISIVGQIVGKIQRLWPYFLAKNRSFSSLLNLQSKSINFNFGHFSAKYQGYSLTFWPKIAHFHHFSICNQNQSISILVIFRQNTKVIALLFGQKSLIFITFQSAIKINQFQFFGKMVIFRQNTKVIALLFGQKSLIFITFQSAIKINQFQLLVIFRQNTKVIALLFGQKSLIFITFQSAIKINQFQFWSFVGKIPRL